jgi:hypothetical protein
LGTAEVLVGMRVADKGLEVGWSRLERGRTAGQNLQRCGEDCGRRLGSEHQDPRFGAIVQTRLLIVKDPEAKGVPWEGSVCRKGGEVVVLKLE